MNSLLKYIKSDFYNLSNRLQDENYNVASGNFKIKDLRKAIQEKNPAFINHKGKSYLLIGEDEDYFILHNGKDKKVLTDKTLSKSFNGDAVIVYSSESNDDDNNNLFIYSPYEDYFDDIHFKETLKSRLTSIKSGESFLPPHPVVLKFIQDESKRSTLNGIEILLHNSFNAIDEVFFRLGNIYYNTSLNDEDKKKLNILFKKNKNTENPVFTDKRYLENEINFFSCLYTWYLKSKYIDRNYINILKYYSNEALALLESIFIRNSFDNTVSKDFEEFENQYDSWMEKAKSKFYKIGTRLIKVKSPHKIPESILLAGVKTRVVQKNNNHTWHLIREGKLKDKIVITKGNMIDTDYMDRCSNEILSKAKVYQSKGFNNIKSLFGIRRLSAG